MNAQVDPDSETIQQKLEKWYEIKEQMAQLKEQELGLRLELYKNYFVAKDEHGVEILPKEGTNNFKLDDGFVLKAQRVINRSVDQGSLEALKEERLELSKVIASGRFTEAEAARWEQLKVLPLDDLVRYKPEVETRVYRTLTAEQRQLFDTTLIIKDGTPQMDIVKPKRAS